MVTVLFVEMVGIEARKKKERSRKKEGMKFIGDDINKLSTTMHDEDDCYFLFVIII